MTTIAKNLDQIMQQIASTALSCGVNPETIVLVAVSKTKSISLIEEAIKAGQHQFGENYVQEGVKKINYFLENTPTIPIVWHFIGPLQSNKTRLVAQYFDWVQTIDRIKIARRLNAQRPANTLPLNVLIQINISDELSKSGVNACDLPELARQIAALPNLKLRGLMAIPASLASTDHQLKVFKRMFELFSELKRQYPDVDTLSMGMSSDIQTAILAGSTMVRVGHAIFGHRN